MGAAAAISRNWTERKKPSAKSKRSKDEEVQELWYAYREHRDPAIREQLIVRHARYVQFVVRRLAISLPSFMSEEDLLSYAIFGLIQAVESFDPDVGVRFEAFAKLRIRGAILDELRALDWAPRSVRTWGRKIERARAELERTLSREPTTAELASELGCSEVELIKHQDDVRVSMIRRLAEFEDGEESSSTLDTLLIPTSTKDDPEEQVADDARKQELAKLLTELDPRERLVITLYYYEKCTLKEIGEVLGVSDSRASQLHSRALRTLREAMIAAREEGR